MDKKSVNASEKTNLKKAIPSIIVKFKEELRDISIASGNFESSNIQYSLKDFEKVVSMFEVEHILPSVTEHREEIIKWKKNAEKNLKRSIPNLNLFFRIRVQSEEEADSLIKELNKLPEVEYAVRAGTAAPPPFTTTDCWTDTQGYMDPADVGVNAPYAWLFENGKGDGVKVCDVEKGFRNHEDLPIETGHASQIAPDITTNPPDFTNNASHGTAVLGILVGKHDEKGINGICPNVDMYFSCESRWGPADDYRAQSIYDAMNLVGQGDIILLESQIGGPNCEPVEWDADVHTAILTAVGNNRIVIEAAGNGDAKGLNGQDKQNLDTKTCPRNGSNLKIWDPDSTDFDDSYAIIVGAGKSNGPLCNDPNESYGPLNEKTDSSNFGKRVNCHAWGEFVRTTGDNGSLQRTTPVWNPYYDYTCNFGGTSSASAIIAGVAACFQAIYKKAYESTGDFLDPKTMRDYLSNPLYGTPQEYGGLYHPDNYPIGPMPDLKKLLCAAGIQADVYMRDHVDDDGTIPFAGTHICHSPDIIPRKNSVASPEIDFGVAHWDEPNLGENIELGQDNFIYFRMHNKGNVSDNVSVQLYWSDPAAFIHPSSWNPIGVLQNINVNAWEHKVVGPIDWEKNSIPQTGHFCLIAVINSNRDPITIPNAFTSVSDYLDFIKNNNNICYRNVFIEDVIPEGEPGAIPEGEPGAIPEGEPGAIPEGEPGAIPPLPLMLKGLPGLRGYHDLEIKHHLPVGAEVIIQIEKQIPKYSERITYKKEKTIIQTISPYTRLKNIHGRPVFVNDILLKKGEKVKAEIKINSPKDTPPGNYLIYVNQYFKGKQLGRVNYILCIKEPKT